MIKKIISLLVILSAACITVNAEVPEGDLSAGMNPDYKNVYIEGKADLSLAGKDIGILVLKDQDGSIENIAQVKADSDGSYYYKFKTDKDLTDGYTVKALHGANDVSESIIRAEQSETSFEISAAFDVDKPNEKVVINTINKYLDNAEANVLFAFYDDAGSLIGCSSENVSSGYAISKATELYIPEIPENAKQLKVFIWKNITEMIPLHQSLEKACIQQFDTDDLTSVAPNTYSMD